MNTRIKYFYEHFQTMKSGANSDSLANYYASHRASAILRHNDDREIGRLFAEYRDRLIIIDGDNKKEHLYFIPKTKVDRYGDNRVYLNISENHLKEVEI
jgi:hypothetical protein